jgi:hypothetical protein
MPPFNHFEIFSPRVALIDLGSRPPPGQFQHQHHQMLNTAINRILTAKCESKAWFSFHARSLSIKWMAYEGAVNLYPIMKGSFADHLSLSDIIYELEMDASSIVPLGSAVFCGVIYTRS